MSALGVRPARAGDGAAIAALHNPFIRDTIVTFTTRERTPLEVDDLLREGQPHWLLEDSGRAMGFATYFPFRKGPGYARTVEHTLVLDPVARGRGGGRALMAALEGHAAQSGMHSLFAGVSGENAQGVAFHAALGFAHVARLREVGWKFGRWHDLVLMQKFLSGPGSPG